VPTEVLIEVRAGLFPALSAPSQGVQPAPDHVLHGCIS